MEQAKTFGVKIRPRTSGRNAMGGMDDSCRGLASTRPRAEPNVGTLRFLELQPAAHRNVGKRASLRP